MTESSVHIPLRYVARTTYQLTLVGHFRVPDSILVIPKTWPHASGFERFWYASRLSSLQERGEYIERCTLHS